MAKKTLLPIVISQEQKDHYLSVKKWLRLHNIPFTPISPVRLSVDIRNIHEDKEIEWIEISTFKY